MILLDGKATSDIIKDEIEKAIEARKTKGLKIPHLAAIIVGSDGASLTYVNNKVKSCHRVGIISTLIKLDKNISQQKLLKEINKLNEDANVDGFIVQLPLPKHIDEQKIIMAIEPDKDVDGFHPLNVGKMALNLPTFLSATPYGILELLERYKVETSGKHVVVIGRSHIVGEPMSILLAQKRRYGNATVTLTHSRTKDLKKITLQADIIIAALGTPNFLTADMVKEKVVIVDVGITRVKDDTKPRGYSLCGDVHFESVSKKASYITPVPGGVGPMTIAMLLKNTLFACQNKD